MVGGIACIAIALFGVLWTIGASSISGNISSIGGGFDLYGESAFIGSPLDTVDAIFPLFGVIFVIIAIVAAIYNFKNATSQNRYSEFDIVDTQEEGDPLNERFGPNPSDDSKADPHADRFCPYCGAPAKGDHRYCKKCGKPLD